ncbi:MAG: hypothetical protein H6625_12215 [Bdellovibrionaceae bacterium]|nr:hypothetical protein [Pseudobdellovibrionaceae bacterium]
MGFEIVFKNSLNSLIAMTFIFSIIGCQDPKTPLLMEPVKEAEVFKEKVLPPQQKVNTKVDIIFVLDNSNSMENEIEFLKSNSHKLTEKLLQFSQIDPHVGVLYVHDSTRYTNDPKQSNGVLKHHPETNKIQYFEKGELVSLNSNANQKYLSKETLHLLPSYFDIEVPFVARRGTKTVKGVKTELYPIGPEVEEAFSPVLAATKNSKYQKTFFREDALLVLIFVTDAETGDIPSDKLKSQPELKDVVENIDPVMLYNQILVFKKGKASDILAYGVLCENEDIECQNNGIEHPSLKIKKFINIVHEKRSAELNARVEGSQRNEKKLDQLKVLNLRSENWGEKLSVIGEAISNETILRSIKLQFVPEVELTQIKGSKAYKISPQLSVKMGDKVLEFGKHWLYDAAQNSVTLLPSVLAFKEVKTQSFSVTGVAVTMDQYAKPLSF